MALLLAALGALLALSYGTATQDDAFISLRYAQNLVDGHGLVYNPGEYVEGYTNLSWTLLLAGLLAAGLDPVGGSTALGWVSLFALVLASWQLARSHHPGWWALIAPGLIALDGQVALEAIEGLETVFYAAVLALATWRLFEELRGDRPHLLSSALFSLACLTRPEAPLLIGLLHVGLFLGAWRQGRALPQLKASLAGAAVVVTTLVALTAFRLGYYGDPLPNTFYAKTGGAAWGRGLRYLGAHALSHPLLWLLVAARLLLGRWSPRAIALSLACSGWLIYVASVGGDFKPTGRFLIPILPLLGLLAVEAVDLLEARWPTAKLGLAAVLVLGAAPYWSVDQQARSWAEERHANLVARRLVGVWMAENLPADSVMAIHSAGAIPYYAGLHTIDMWGLTNRHIAHTQADAFGTGLAGHEKSDPLYVFSLEPDLYLPEDGVFTLKHRDLEPGPGFPDEFEDDYTQIHVRIDYGVLNAWMRRDSYRAWQGLPPR
jgi:arabinofuranosyltransferase